MDNGSRKSKKSRKLEDAEERYRDLVACECVGCFCFKTCIDGAKAENTMEQNVGRAPHSSVLVYQKVKIYHLESFVFEDVRERITFLDV